MSDITGAEKRKFEQLFGMSSRYVLDFSNRTFAELVQDATGRDIYDEKYSHGGSSKANRLRTFWTQESNPVVARLLEAILEYGGENTQFEDKAILLDNARRAVARIAQANTVEQADVITEIGGEADFDTIARDIRDKIEKNEPEVALDRLHTFVTKYIRSLCPAHGIATPREKPLHCIFGEYVKKLQAAGALESPMSERILKNSIGVRPLKFGQAQCGNAFPTVLIKSAEQPCAFVMAPPAWISELLLPGTISKCTDPETKSPGQSIEESTGTLTLSLISRP